MTASMPPSTTPPHPEPETRASLRVRLWVACVSGGAVSGLGSLWALSLRGRPGAIDPAELLAWLPAYSVAGMLVGLFFAAWLDHHLVGHLRGLLRGLRTERVAELRGLPSAAGWGELSDLTTAASELLGQQRRAARSVTEMEQQRGHLAKLQQAVERWAHEEAWEAPILPPGPVEDLHDALSRGLARRAVVDDQNREVAGQIARELSGALGDAQESATQAERGFVEATAMLTTVRELQRLTSELQNALDQAGGATGTEAPAGTREVLEDLVAASHDSVESLGRGLARVHDVAEQVQQLANRSTLIAIQVVTALRHEEGDADVADELKRLARDVRETTERASQFALEVETAVADATARMREARERAFARLEAPAPAAAPSGGRAMDDARRLLERVREMVQDAARKGERLSQAGERASRAAERLARRVDEESAESEALALRLSPPAAAADDPSATAVELRLLHDEAPADAPAAARPKEERP